MGGIEGILGMPDKYHALRSVLIALLLTGITVGVTDSTEPRLVEQTFRAIHDCMDPLARSMA